MKKLITALAILTSINSFASCGGGPDVDLRKVHPQIMSSLTIQDQGNVGYCYAYAGKFLYDFQRYLKTANNKMSITALGTTSPSWSAALGMKEGKAFTDEGGFVCNVVNGLSSQSKNCLNSSLSEKSFHELGPQLYRFLFDSDNLMASYQGQRNPMWNQFPIMTEREFSPSVKLSGEKLKVRTGFINLQRKIRNALAGRNIPSSYAASAFEYYDLVRISHYKSTYPTLPAAFAVTIAEKSCSTWVPSVKSICKEGPAYSLDKINSELTKNLPVGISYCASVLTDKQYRGYPQTGVNPDCGMHASVIIGRRATPYGSCEYLVRNSWGVGRTKYDWKTDKGDIWIDSDALNDNIREFQTVR